MFGSGASVEIVRKGHKTNSYDDSNAPDVIDFKFVRGVGGRGEVEDLLIRTTKTNDMAEMDANETIKTSLHPVLLIGILKIEGGIQVTKVK